MTYSADFRNQVIRNIKQKDMSIRQVCVFYHISKTTLQRWLKDPSIQKTRNKTPNKIPNDALLKDVELYPDDYLYERAQRFNCSKSGIEAALKRLGISKKKTLEHPKAYTVKRAHYLSKLKDYIVQGFPIVYMDESGFEQHETIRPFGYAPIGKTLY
ncbi:IS630 transposase-related protein [Psychrobacter urativorans]|uniref:IS630 transposase-related protein n=1 Tax=Psychrobacter urativorans TaxID=45610 RepID=UPI001D104FBB|nr:IS630 transposase-related protein [Psychrobacter urativorans]